MGLKDFSLDTHVCCLSDTYHSPSETALLTETHLGTGGKAASVSRLLQSSQSLKATLLLLVREVVCPVSSGVVKLGQQMFKCSRQSQEGLFQAR